MQIHSRLTCYWQRLVHAWKRGNENYVFHGPSFCGAKLHALQVSPFIGCIKTWGKVLIGKVGNNRRRQQRNFTYLVIKCCSRHRFSYVVCNQFYVWWINFELKQISTRAWPETQTSWARARARACVVYTCRKHLSDVVATCSASANGNKAVMNWNDDTLNKYTRNYVLPYCWRRLSKWSYIFTCH